MTREEFKRRHTPVWTRLEQHLDLLDARGRRRTPSYARVVEASDLAEFDRLYRQVCKHLALARLRSYGVDLVDYLNDLALRCHGGFYGARSGYLASLATYFSFGFPSAVRRHWRPVLISAAIFVLPAIATAAAVYLEPDLIYAALDPGRVRDMEEMYDPASNYRTHERADAGDLQMFGFYIMNNVGIAFQTFGSGILLGVGTMFFLALNGVVLGAVAVHLTRVGFASTFFEFVVGHAAFELTAIVLAGAAGLNLGWSILAPGRHRRGEALRLAARRSVEIIYGVAAMLVAAAVIEAFWSSSHAVPGGVKYGVGALLWSGTLAYFVLAGRSRGS